MTDRKENMKKFIEASALLQMFQDDEMLSCDRPFDVYQWAANIIEECPAAENVYQAPLSIGQRVQTADGRFGVVDTYYIGKKGLQRIFVRLDNGERINFTPKGIGKDVFVLEDEISRRNPREESPCDNA